MAQQASSFPIGVRDFNGSFTGSKIFSKRDFLLIGFWCPYIGVLNRTCPWLRPCPLLKQKIRLSDFQSRILQTVRHPKGSDFTLSVQVRVYPGLRDYDQSFVPTPESWEVGFCFVAIDTRLLYFVASVCKMYT